MPFGSVKDITPISVFGTVPLVLVVNTSVAAKNTRELVALVKASPGKLNYSSAGNGSVLHLAGELYKKQAGAFITHIPYCSTGPLTTALMGGQVDTAFLSVTAAAPHIKGGKLRALGVSMRARTSMLPDVPTLAESGLPGYSSDAWLAIIAPGGTPQTHRAGPVPEVQDHTGQQGHPKQLACVRRHNSGGHPRASRAFLCERIGQARKTGQAFGCSR